ncbi:MAG: response regulator [Akkermansiaceae bacterium]|nr:response regulator [Akkermansiaceae bacterium]
MNHPSASGDPPSAKPHGRLRILCVEDNEGDFLLLREHLRDADLDPVPDLCRAATLAEAVETLGKENGEPPVDIVLLDLSLPDSLGPETLDRIAEVAPRTPVTILSGNADRELAVSMVQSGAQDYLPKDSLNGELLTRSILYALERQRSRRRLEDLNLRLHRATEDLKTAQMQLIQAEKLDSLGRLAAGVAHEVKNPLATLQLGVDYFRRRAGEMDESGVFMVDQMQQAIERADKIIRGMVDYSRDQTVQLKESNINRVARQALRLVNHELTRASVTVDEDFTDPIPAVRADEGKLEQVVINVLMNAIQAMGGQPAEDGGRGRTLHVGTFWDQLPKIERDEGLRHYERLRAQDHVVVLEIRDEGPGVPEDKINRLFEPFYTTKPTGEGTGLGLSVARNIVDLHHGHLEVRNVEDPRGLRVRILLKACDVPVGQGPSPDSRNLTRPIKLKAP